MESFFTSFDGTKIFL